MKGKRRNWTYNGIIYAIGGYAPLYTTHRIQDRWSIGKLEFNPFIKTSGGVQKIMQPIHRQLQLTAGIDPHGVKKELERRELDIEEGERKVEEKNSVQGRNQFRT